MNLFMIRILSSFLLLMSCYGYTQTAVDKTLTSQKLDKDVMIKNVCTQVFKYNLSTGLYFDDKSDETDPMVKIYIFDTFGNFLKHGVSHLIGWPGTKNRKPLALCDHGFLNEHSEYEVQKEIIGHFTPKTIAI